MLALKSIKDLPEMAIKGLFVEFSQLKL